MKSDLKMPQGNSLKEMVSRNGLIVIRNDYLLSGGFGFGEDFDFSTIICCFLP